MVYNEMVYRPATLGERLQAKFGGRISSAVRDGSDVAEEGKGEVLSFFGRADESGSDRAMPSARRRAAASASQNFARQSGAGVSSPAAQTRGAVHARPKRVSARKDAPAKQVKTPAPEVAAAFSRAYAAGNGARRAAAAVSGTPKRRYAHGAVPDGALRRGRSNIPGSRHAVLVTDTSADITVKSKIKTAFASRRVAEHKAAKAPFPLAFVTLIVICTFMVMAILFSFARIGEYSDKISTLKAEQKTLDDTAAKLELQLAEREDIRLIEEIAVNEIGMVSSDMVQTKFVSVAGADRVEVMETGDGDENDGGAFAAILSVFGEYFD